MPLTEIKQSRYNRKKLCYISQLTGMLRFERDTGLSRFGSRTRKQIAASRDNK